MTDITTQTQAALAAIAEAASLDALEDQRLDALGKKGWVSLALKTLGGMSPDERTATAPAIQSARAAIAEALDAKKAALEAAELEAQMARETIDLTLPAAAAFKGSVHPVSQVMDERDFRRPGLRGGDRAGDRGRLAQFHRAQHG
jgi:phenylalanyl-tRNA synthetase alpha chain